MLVMTLSIVYGGVPVSEVIPIPRFIGDESTQSSKVQILTVEQIEFG